MFLATTTNALVVGLLVTVLAVRPTLISANQQLEDLILARESEVEAIVSKAVELYEDSVCGETEQCACILNACQSRLNVAFCADTFGGCDGTSDEDEEGQSRNLDFTESTTRTVSSDMTQSIRTDMCWTQALDEVFISNYGGTVEQDDSTLRWQYFGTPDGFYRIYPGVPQETCYTYDTRLRPWYVAATSGPKDVVLVLDTSGSMSGHRIALLKEAVQTVLTSLTLNDYVAIVQFSSAASQLCSGMSCNSLSQATAENVGKLRTQVDALFASGSTNFGAGVDMAFNILSNTVGEEKTANCHTAILFLTDGEIMMGARGQELLNDIQTRQQQRDNAGQQRAVFFTYSLGASAAQDEPKAMACDNDGIWAPIADGGDLRTQMGHFYDYFASLRRQTSEAGVVWVEPYEDASGAGRMTTASKAVYDYSVEPAKLIGVVGVDLLISDIEKVEPNYQQLLTFLAQRSNQCPTLELDVCELQSLRTREYSESTFGSFIDENDRKCDPDLQCSFSQSKCVKDGQVYTRPSLSTSPYCVQPRESYDDEACGSCASSGSPDGSDPDDSSGGADGGVVAGAVIGALIGIFIIGGIVYFCASTAAAKTTLHSPGQAAGIATASPQAPPASYSAQVADAPPPYNPQWSHA